jgi:hypothetical protein
VIKKIDDLDAEIINAENFLKGVKPDIKGVETNGILCSH